MIVHHILALVSVALLAQAGTSQPSSTWIADVKANPGTLAGQEVRIEGEVMDVRSTSPTARRGFYRLTDASDPAGVLVRTDQLPMEGGTFRLRARIAEDQLVPGSLLLDELERDATNAAPIAPKAALVISGFALLTIAALFIRARSEERRHAVAPPLWLLPDAGPYGKALAVTGAPPAPLKYQPELEEADRRQREILRRRRKSLFRALIGSVAITGSSAVWAIDARPGAGQVPAFIFIDSNDPASRAPRRLALNPDSVVDSIGPTLITIPPARAESATQRRDPPEVASAPRIGSADPASTGKPPVELPPADSVTRVEVVPPAPAPPPPAPAPAPPPSPAPPPAPEPQESLPDPEVERSRAEETLGAGARRLVAAINSRSMNDLAFLLPETMAGDIGRRERFLKLIKDFGARASLGGTEDAILADSRGEARFTVTVAWRGDFGVDRRKAGRFLGVARRGAAGWQFEGARLLDAVP